MGYFNLPCSLHHSCFCSSFLKFSDIHNWTVKVLVVAEDAAVPRSQLLLSFQNTFWTNISQSQRRTALCQFWKINKTLFDFKLKQISDVCQAFVLLLSVGSCQDIGIANWMRQQLSQMVTDCSLCRGVQEYLSCTFLEKHPFGGCLLLLWKKGWVIRKTSFFFKEKKACG